MSNWKTKLDDAKEKVCWQLIERWDIIKWVLLPALVLAGCFLGACMCSALDWMLRTLF